MSNVATEASVIRVKMAGIGYGTADDTIETLLGSCIGIAIWDRGVKVGGLAHVVLPESNGRPGSPGKFADTAVLELKAQLLKRGARPRKLTAKIAGGSTMFGARTARDIGEKNYQATLMHLRSQGIPVVAEHVGGSQGRVVVFSPGDGSLAIHIGRQLVTTI